MTERTPVEVTNLDRSGCPTIPWSRPRDLLAAPPDSDPPGAHGASFLGTVRPDGQPHAAGVGAGWYEGDLYFTSGSATRKSRNLAANPACTIAMSLNGLDLVFEGAAMRVNDPVVLEAVAALCRQGGWPAEVDGDALTAPFSAPSAGPPPWHLYKFTYHTVFGVATAEPSGATRWRFDPSS